MCASASVSRTALAILEALKGEEDEEGVESSCPSWSREKCGVRLRSFAAMQWRPDRMSPEVFARCGWRCERRGDDCFFVCDDCGAACPESDYAHSVRCVWRDVSVPASVWDDDDTSAQARHLAQRLRQAARQGHCLDEHLAERYAARGWQLVAGDDQPSQQTHDEGEDKTLLDCRVCAERISLSRDSKEEEEHGKKGEEEENTKKKRQKTQTTDPVLAHRWFCPHRRTSPEERGG